MGTNLLRAYMHGFFIDIRLYHKVTNSFQYNLLRWNSITVNTWLLACIACGINFQLHIYVRIIQHDLTSCICRGYRSTMIEHSRKFCTLLYHITVRLEVYSPVASKWSRQGLEVNVVFAIFLAFYPYCIITFRTYVSKCRRISFSGQIFSGTFCIWRISQETNPRQDWRGTR